ncbi:MAG: outer membrane beta-barrel protein, partial [Mariprofundaceae bacterium]
MKHMIKIAGIALAIVFSATAAHAGDIKPYVGAGIGMFTADFNNGFKAKNAVGFYINGGADFNDFIGAELRVGTIGSKKISNAEGGGKIKTDYFISYLAKPQFHFTPEASIYALAGATTVKMTGSSTFGSSSVTSTKLTY